ncbi:hypothetical protein C818_00991 [Lachnospiraceae bacterium MD308]|nr:hypothetical protein C818_00991 [Lachnospiraceae bacterium MD308]
MWGVGIQRINFDYKSCNFSREIQITIVKIKKMLYCYRGGRKNGTNS